MAGAGAAGAAAGAAGAVAGAAATGAGAEVAGADASSKSERFLPDFTTVKVIEVSMKRVATTAVNFVKKFAPPELPKTVWLEPPPAIPSPPSLPA